MDLKSKPFEIIRKIQLLRIGEHLSLPPESEICTMMAIRELNSAPGGRASVSGIAELMNVAVPTVSRCLGKLSAKNYIVKSANAADRRGTCVSLSAEGEAVCHESEDKMTDFVDRALSHIDEEELKQFFLTFDHLYEALRIELSKISVR